MSSWDRARFIPWSRIPQDGSNLEQHKEAIFRELRMEAQIKQAQLERQIVSEDGTETTTENGSTNTKIPYSTMDLLKNFAFGGCIGTITGAVFGFMEGMKGAQDSPVLKKASNMAKTKYMLQGTTRSATLLGVYFGGFHVLKYGVRITLDPGDLSEIAIAGIASMGVLFSRPTLRASVPQAGMLVVMDTVQLYMKEFS